MSASDSPFAIPVTCPSGTDKTFPSRRNTALSNERRVRVLASKNAVIAILPSSGFSNSTFRVSNRAASCEIAVTVRRSNWRGLTMEDPAKILQSLAVDVAAACVQQCLRTKMPAL